ncbi:very short patch repair endonuclease [Actinoplanes sp. CA-131856]
MQGILVGSEPKDEAAPAAGKQLPLRAPAATSPAVRRVMQGNRRRDTRPELAIRRAAHRRGLRYRVDARPVAGRARRADMVFPRLQVAVFVDGCFWHGCPDHYRPTRSNRDYWHSKIARNVARDRETDEWLRSAGWTVVRVWEHEVPDEAVDRLIAVKSALAEKLPDRGVP